MRNWQKFRLRQLITAVLGMGLVLAVIAGCDQAAVTSSGAPAGAQGAKPVAATAGPFETVRSASEIYLSSDKAKTPNITASDLYMNLNDGDTSNDPFILSVRSASDYAKGHVPGAVNIPWREVAKPENLAKLPKDKQIVVYCYTGHTGSQATALLNAMGYSAVNLFQGMCGWTKDTAAATGCPTIADFKDYSFEIVSNPATGSYSTPVLNVTASLDQLETVRSAADAYLVSDKAKTPNITASDLYMNLNDGDRSNDPLIVSVRAASDYAKGHLPGAVNIPWREVAKPENLAKLPKDKQIVVYCYTGHTGSQATALLNAMGYSVMNLKYGMTAWTKNADIAPNRYDPEKVKDYKVVSGTNPT